MPTYIVKTIVEELQAILHLTSTETNDIDYLTLRLKALNQMPEDTLFRGYDCKLIKKRISQLNKEQQQ